MCQGTEKYRAEQNDDQCGKETIKKKKSNSTPTEDDKHKKVDEFYENFWHNVLLRLQMYACDKTEIL